MQNRIAADRQQRFGRASEERFDAVVVGGGITGAGVALDLVTRGLSVLLLEQGDWGGQTSSASSRLVHGGLRYLEQFDFGLVRESCLERAWLLDAAAGYTWPERFHFPIQRGDRVGRLKMAAGLQLYGALSLPHPLGWPRMASRSSLLRAIPGLSPDRLRGGGSYLDAATDDARLTLAVIKTAVNRGAVAISRAGATSIDPGTNGAVVEVVDRLSGETSTATTRVVILAGGPGTDSLRKLAHLDTPRWIAPTRGSHIVVHRSRLPIDGAVIFPGVDGRIMFLIPWPQYTIVGTTDVDADATDLRAAIHPTGAEVDYLIDSANQLLPGAELSRTDVLSAWSGLRPLLHQSGDPSSRSREERIEQEGAVFTIAGGKLTGFRAMAQHLAPRVVATIGRGERSRISPTRRLRLVGALDRRVARPAWPVSIDGEELLRRAFERRYGASAATVRQYCRDAAGGDTPLDGETRLGEVDWGVEHDDLITASDFLLRRTDVGYAAANDVAKHESTVQARLVELGVNAAQWPKEVDNSAEELAARHPPLAEDRLTS